MENLKCLFCQFPWDILLFALALGGLLWWLLSRFLAGRFKGHDSELQDRINFLEGELEACRKSKISGSLGANLDANASGKANLNVSADDAEGFDGKTKSGIAGVTGIAAFGGAPSTASKDDLKIVEGIGPKIEDLFNAAGIFTFDQCAKTSVEKLKEILNAGGSRFQMHDPTTWPDQCALARDGKWDELKKWQDELNAGKA